MEIKGESRKDSIRMQGVYLLKTSVYDNFMSMVLLSLIAYQPVIYFVVN
jgi:hypothetical protein